jgi:hypothetical protein
LETDLGKLSTCDALDSFFPNSKPKLPHELGPNSLDIFVRPNSQSTQSIGKLREFSAKSREVRAVEIVKELQDAPDREGRCEIVSTRNNLGRRLELCINPILEALSWKGVELDERQIRLRISHILQTKLSACRQSQKSSSQKILSVRSRLFRS